MRILIFTVAIMVLGWIALTHQFDVSDASNCDTGQQEWSGGIAPDCVR